MHVDLEKPQMLSHALLTCEPMRLQNVPTPAKTQRGNMFAWKFP